MRGCRKVFSSREGAKARINALSTGIRWGCLARCNVEVCLQCALILGTRPDRCLPTSSSLAARTSFTASPKRGGNEVSSSERARFVDEFDRNLRRANWIIYIGLAVGLGIVLWVSMRGGFEITKPGMLAATGLVMIPYIGYFQLGMGVAARELAGRMPVAGARSPRGDEALTVSAHEVRTTCRCSLWGAGDSVRGQFAWGCLFGLNRLWLAFGAALILIAAVQAFRKWRFESDDPYQDLARASSLPELDLSVDDSAPQGRESGVMSLWSRSLAGVCPFLTPAGKQLVQKPSFFPILMIGLGTWALFTVARGVTKGEFSHSCVALSAHTNARRSRSAFGCQWAGMQSSPASAYGLRS